MRCCHHLHVLMLLLGTFASVRASAPPSRVPPPEPEPRNDAGGVLYGGVVTALKKDSITVQYDDEPPKMFPVSATLSAGEIPLDPRPIPGRQQAYSLSPFQMYRFSDVKIGDWVCVGYSKIGGVVVCDHIQIIKRPGGVVPPLPKEVEELRHPVKQWSLRHPGQPVPKALAEYPPPISYHEYMNAYWDLVDKGIPFPEKFGDERRWLTAPMPREVQPKPVPKL
jgi:hypothetical protein